MCGICGFSWDDKAMLKRMADSIAHRGPDSHGYYTDSSVSLAQRRLAIIDLSKNGHQPMFNEDKDICIIFNGEIYNYMELRPELERRGHRFFSNSDTEVIIHSYEEYGERCVDKLGGFFAFCIYDQKKKRLFLARDRLGKKPLYYHHDGRDLIFASEIKAILEHESIPRLIDKDAFNNYLALRYNPLHKTIFQGINKLPPGHTLSFDLKTREMLIARYWSVDNSTRNIARRTEEKTASDILGLLTDSVEKRMISDVPVGAFLSGGIDSSSVVALMSRLTPEAVKTFSVGFEDDRIGNELGYARQVAEAFATDHTELMIGSGQAVKELPKMVWHLDEPLSDPATVPNYLLSREAKKKVTVILTGDGADELFAGYDQYKFMMLGERFKWVPRFIRGGLAPAAVEAMPYSVLNRIYPYAKSNGKEMFRRFGKFFSQIKENKAGAYLEIISVFDRRERERLMADKASEQGIDLASQLNRQYFSNTNSTLSNIQRLDIERYLVEDLLMKPDKMCMAFAIEARVPFLDHRLVEYAFTIDPKLKLHGMTTKYIMKKAVSTILPKSITQRRKQPFVVPLDSWLDRDLKGTLHSLIADGNLVRAGLLRREGIQRIFERYPSSKMYYGRQLWSLANLELWHRIYIGREDYRSINL